MFPDIESVARARHLPKLSCPPMREQGLYVEAFGVQAEQHDASAAFAAFDARLAAIHQPVAFKGSNEGAMSVHRQELEAMFAAFLGENYPADRIGAVAELQGNLHRLQAELLTKLEQGKIQPQAYVRLFNHALMSTFYTCESILGADDFVQLFGDAPDRMGGFIDEEQFLSSR